MAGGRSRRLGGFKALVELCGRPMISYALEAVSGLASDVVVVVSAEEQARALRASGALGDARIAMDRPGLGPSCPLLGLSSGLSEAGGQEALVLACDMPLASRQGLSLLVEILSHMNAVVPRWPNGYVEPLQAVYKVGPALRASEEALRSGGAVDMRSFLRALGRVRYVSTRMLEELDPGLNTFLNVNTPADLRRAEYALRARGACGGH